MQLDVGSYIGNASNPRTISISVGGTPDSVMVKADAATSSLYWRTDDMAANESQQITSNGTSTTAITSLGSNEFTVNSTLNANGVDYYYVAIRDNGEGDFAVGSYTGNGTSQSINAGFEGIAAITSGDASDGLMGTASQGNGEGQHLNEATHITSGGFTFDAQGFDVGSYGNLNFSGEDYYYMAFKADGCYEGSYTGNATDNRDISGVGFTPVFTLTAGDDSTPWYRFGSTGDNSFILQNALASNGIQSFGSDGFQIGDNSSINYSGEDYFFIALYTSESAGTTIDCTLTTVTVSSYDADISAGTTIVATTGTVTVSSLNASIELGTTINCTTGTIEISSHNATIDLGVVVEATTGTVVITSNNAEILAGTDIDCTVGAIEISSLNAIISQQTDIDCTVRVLEISSLDAEIISTTLIEAETGTIVILSHDATILSGGVAVTPPERIYTIPKENRIYTIEAEDRIYTIIK